jgi:hypothetical protein
LIDTVLEAIENYEESGQHWRDMMYVAYIRRTGIDPVNVALVETEGDAGTKYYHFVFCDVEDDTGEMIFMDTPPWYRRWLEQVYRMGEQANKWAALLLLLVGLGVVVRRK